MKKVGKFYRWGVHAKKGGEEKKKMVVIPRNGEKSYAFLCFTEKSRERERERELSHFIALFFFCNGR